MKAANRVFLITMGMLAAACDQSKVSPDKLTYERQEQIALECRKTGKIATDDYCKEVVSVFAPEQRRRREKARLEKELSEKPITSLNMQQ